MDVLYKDGKKRGEIRTVNGEVVFFHDQPTKSTFMVAHQSHMSIPVDVMQYLTERGIGKFYARYKTRDMNFFVVDLETYRAHGVIQQYRNFEPQYFLHKKYWTEAPAANVHTENELKHLVEL